jgi:hypothetical protein
MEDRQPAHAEAGGHPFGERSPFEVGHRTHEIPKARKPLTRRSRPLVAGQR